MVENIIKTKLSRTETSLGSTIQIALFKKKKLA